ncbi:hypothetical protein [Streptomyces sp. NPDC013457]
MFADQAKGGLVGMVESPATDPVVQLGHFLLVALEADALLAL